MGTILDRIDEGNEAVVDFEYWRRLKATPIAKWDELLTLKTNVEKAYREGSLWYLNHTLEALAKWRLP